MIDLETVTRIRQLHHGEHWPVGTIATELGLHHETVERALEEESRTKPAPRPSRFDPYVGFVRETLEKYPRLRATRLWQMLRERGCTLRSARCGRRWRELRPAPHEAFLRRRTFAGGGSASGLGQLRPRRDRRGAPGALRVHPDADVFAVDLPALLPGPVAGELPARPRVRIRGLSGRPPVSALRQPALGGARRGMADAVRFNPRLLELASHYHFAPRACRPGARQ